MQASAELIVGRGRGSRSVVMRMFAEAPLLLRQTSADDDPDLCVHLVGGAAGPLGGDRLHTHVEVADDATVVIRSVAASLAQPGSVDEPSRSSVAVDVGERSVLDWWPEPLVSVRGSRHHLTTEVVLAATASLRWVDEVCLGRAQEPSGELLVRQRIVAAGVPVAAHGLTFGPHDAVIGGTGVHGPARAAITGLVRGPTALPSASQLSDRVRAARFPIDARTTMWIALGDHHEQLRRVLAQLGLDRDARFAGA